VNSVDYYIIARQQQRQRGHGNGAMVVDGIYKYFVILMSFCGLTATYQ
jgi:hypothetical protein